MRKSLTLLFTVGMVLCALAPANAEELKVTVPFDFVVGGKALPAATYTIREALSNDNTGLAFLAEGAAALARASAIDSSVTGTKLVFHRIGDQYFLSDVVSPKGKLHFVASRQEKQLAGSMQSLAINGSN